MGFMQSDKLGESVDRQMRLRVGGQSGTCALFAVPTVHPDGGQAQLPARLDIVMLALSDMENLVAIYPHVSELLKCPLKMWKARFV